MLPDYRNSNPYQKQLIAGLERRGVDVEVADSALLFPVLRACLDRGIPDVVHLHWAHRFVATDRSLFVLLLGLRLLFDLAVLRLVGVRVVWTVHNRNDHERRSPGVECLVRHLLARVCSGIVVHCESARETVREAYRLPDRVADRIRVVPHGNYLDAYENDASPSTARDQLDLPPDATVFLYFGTIRRYKNVPALLDAFASVDEADARLLVAGSAWGDDLEAAVRERSARDERVRAIIEYVPDETIQRYLNAADAVVLPFENVLTSGSALLAMSFGRALIVPDIGCPAERIGDDGGFTYDPEDPNGLRTALSRALDPASDLDVMGERNLAVARQLDWDSIAARTLEVYLGRSAVRDRVAEPTVARTEA